MPAAAKPATPRGGSTSTSTKRAPSSSATTKAKPASRGASPAAVPSKKPVIDAKAANKKATTPKAGSPTSTKKRAASPKSKKGDANTSVATTAASAKKKAKPSAVGNFYIPAHNLSFGSDPRKGKASKAPVDADTSIGSEALSAQGSPSQPNASNASFSNPAALFSLSASRVAAQQERERSEAAAASVSAAEQVEGEERVGGDSPASVSPLIHPTSQTSAPLPVVPKFQSYFFGVPKPEQTFSPARAANEADAAAAAAATTEPTAEAPVDGQPESISREASPQPEAPKLVSFDKEISEAEANQAALTADGSSPSPKRNGKKKSSSSSASPKRIKKSGSTASSTASKGKSKSNGASKSKSRKSSKSAERVEDKPPGPIQRLFGDIAKTGLTGAPTLASLAIAARRTGSEVDLKQAAATNNTNSNGTILDASVSDKQTANALFNLGWMLFYGMGGCVVNFKKSYAYFYDAATKYDHPMAYYYLGLQLRDGKGVEKNLLAAHDAFQTSMALVGSDNMAEPKPAADAPAPTASATPNFKTIVFPAEKDRTNAETTEASADAGPPIAIVNESHKRTQTRLKDGEQLEFEGIKQEDVETISHWQIGKLWAAGSVVVLEEVPAQKKEKKPEGSEIEGADGASRAASPHPVTPRAAASSSSPTVPPSRGVSKAPSATNAKTAAKPKAGSVAATTKAPSKKAGSPAKKKGSKKGKKADATNNNGGGALVAIKPYSVPAGLDVSLAADNSVSAQKSTSKSNSALQFRKIRYDADKPTAIAYYTRASANGFEHAALASIILRDDPIPRAELDDE